MPELKPEAILAYLGLEVEKIKTEDDFKSNFESKFGVKDQLLNDKEFVGKIFGKRVGSIDTAAKSGFKKMGVEFAKEEIEGKQVEDVIELGLNKIAEMNKKAMEDYEKTFKGTADEQVKTWKEKYTQVEAKAKDWESMATKTASEFEGFKKDQATRSKSDMINNFKKSSIGKLEYKQDITPVEKMGFETVLNEKYEIDLDENQVPFPKDKKTGERLKSTKTIGQFKNWDEILQEELIANKLAKINPQGGKPAPKYGQAQSQTGEQGAPKKLFIHPSALAAAGQ